MAPSLFLFERKDKKKKKKKERTIGTYSVPISLTDTSSVNIQFSIIAMTLHSKVI